MNEQALANMVEGLAELHVEHLKLENPCSYRSSSFVGCV